VNKPVNSIQRVDTTQLNAGLKNGNDDGASLDLTYDSHSVSSSMDDMGYSLKAQADLENTVYSVEGSPPLTYCVI